MKKVLLYSGGMDSYLIDKLWKPEVKIYVDMHTKYAEVEKQRLPKDVKVINFDLHQWEREDAIIPLRNLYLVMIGSYYGDEICLGATAGDRVLDKSPKFAQLASELLSYLYLPQHWTPGRTVKVNIDFKGYTKVQLLKEYLKQGGNIERAWKESYSCYSGKVEPCWQCKPCIRKAAAFFCNGFREFNVEQKQKLYKSLSPIILQIKQGTYGRGREEESQLTYFYSWLEEENRL